MAVNGEVRTIAPGCPRQCHRVPRKTVLALSVANLILLDKHSKLRFAHSRADLGLLKIGERKIMTLRATVKGSASIRMETNDEMRAEQGQREWLARNLLLRHGCGVLGLKNYLRNITRQATRGEEEIISITSGACFPTDRFLSAMIDIAEERNIFSWRLSRLGRESITRRLSKALTIDDEGWAEPISLSLSPNSIQSGSIHSSQQRQIDSFPYVSLSSAKWSHEGKILSPSSCVVTIEESEEKAAAAVLLSFGSLHFFLSLNELCLSFSFLSSSLSSSNEIQDGI